MKVFLCLCVLWTCFMSFTGADECHQYCPATDTPAVPGLICVDWTHPETNVKCKVCKYEEEACPELDDDDKCQGGPPVPAPYPYECCLVCPSGPPFDCLFDEKMYNVGDKIDSYPTCTCDAPGSIVCTGTPNDLGCDDDDDDDGGDE